MYIDLEGPVFSTLRLIWEQFHSLIVRFEPTSTNAVSDHVTVEPSPSLLCDYSPAPMAMCHVVTVKKCELGTNIVYLRKDN